MDPLSLTASIIALIQLTGTVVEYLNDVKDASKDRARCAIETSNVYNLLVNLKYRLEVSPHDSWYTSVRALAVAGGPLDQYRSALEELQSKLNPASTHGLRKVGNALAWTFTKGEIANILSRVKRLKSLTQIALEMDHFKLSLAIKDDVAFVKSAVPVLKTIKDGREMEDYRMITDWLSPTDFPAQQSDFISKRQAATGLWFLESPTFVSWVKGTSQTLFCPGIPGAGKTMMAAIAVDLLLTTCWEDDVGIAYIYCNYKRQDTQSATDLLSATLRQLVQERSSFGEPVKALHAVHAGRGTRPSLEEVSNALESVLSQYTRVFLIVDALDEYDNHGGTRSTFLTKLRGFQAKTQLNLMVTSRFNLEIMQFFEDSPSLEIRASDTDVERYIAGQMYRLPSCVRRSIDLQTEVQDGIVKATDGMSVAEPVTTLAKS
ncbi:MAG: hypothetical protein M1822_009767 [Bathelium mastoideum]|nr:MAG: hypothetical protein M1822_009767 [Bathelium mastoideum]